MFREAKKTGMDPSQVRIACETLATTNRVVIAGEVRVPETLLKKGKDGKVLHDAAGHPMVNPAKFKSTARKAIKAIGYEQAGFHWKTAKIDVLLHGQSADIAQGVDAERQQGCGRRRPGHHVRLCQPRDPRTAAGADLLRPQDPRDPDRGPQGRQRRRPASSGPTPRAR